MFLPIVFGSYTDSGKSDKYDESSGNTTQTVSIDGTTVSTLSTKSGKAIGWGTAEEAQDNYTGAIAQHSKTTTPSRISF